MKQTNLLRWIEDAEARSVYLLAGEDPAQLAMPAALPDGPAVHPLLTRLRTQLFLGDAARRIVALYRLHSLG